MLIVEFLSIYKALSMLKSYPASPLFSQIHDILSTEDSETQVVLQYFREPHQLSVFLVTINKKEEYRNLHLFYMDSIEEKHGDYRHYTLSYPEAIQLHKFCAQLLKA